MPRPPLAGPDGNADLRQEPPDPRHRRTGPTDPATPPDDRVDWAVTELLREGDRVDVLTVDPDTPADPDRRSGATVLASRAVVVLVTPSENGRDQRERVVMLALPASDATTVAAASLTSAITVTFQ